MSEPTQAASLAKDVKAIIHDCGHGGQVCQFGDDCTGPELADMVWDALAREGYVVVKQAAARNPAAEELS